MRKLHSIPGLLAALLISIIAISGTFLALQPAMESASASSPPQGRISVAELASKVKANQPGVQQIKRKASGLVIAKGVDDLGPWSRVIDVQTGTSLRSYQPSEVFGLIARLHRSFLLGESGRLVSGAGAVLLVVLCISGVILLAKRCGGWSKLLAPAKSKVAGNLHVKIARLSIVGLLISSLTGTYLSLVSFGIVADGGANEPPFPAEVAGGQPASIDQLSVLKATDLSQLRELTFPYEGDLSDAFAMSTNDGAGYVDQTTGTWLTFAPYNFAQMTYEMFYMLHTGIGAGWGSALLGLLLGLCSLGLPVLSLTGVIVWQKRRSGKVAIADNCPVELAQISILYGGEGNSTKGFATSLQNALTALGQRVHLAPMNDVTQNHFDGKYVLILTSTYGDGEAPQSATKFLNKLDALKSGSRCKIAVLGFGDRQFPKFCAFAQQADRALADMGFLQLLPFSTIDRQCSQSFETWSQALGAALALPLSVSHMVDTPKLKKFGVISRHTIQATDPSDLVILRLSMPLGWVGRARRFLGLKGCFEVGDLLGIVPPNSSSPRFYSLASASKDGYLEICVKRHSHGLCSNYLHSLKPGDVIDGFLKPNPAFRPAEGCTPVILIGAGTGIAPLAGFARHNSPQRPMMMYWGGRTNNADFIYREPLLSCVETRQLTSLVTAFSRQAERQYVQDRVREDAPAVREMINNGAQILVCGGASMASGLRAVMNDILRPLGVNVEALKKQNRYLEDVY